MGWESACSKVTDDCACAGAPELARQGLRGQVNAWDEVWCSHFCCHYPTAFVPLSATVHCLATMSTLCTHAAVRWANYSAGRLGNWTGPRMFPISESGVDGERCHCTVPSVAASQSLSCLWHSSGCDQGIGFQHQLIACRCQASGQCSPCRTVLFYSPLAAVGHSELLMVPFLKRAVPSIRL